MTAGTPDERGDGSVEGLVDSSDTLTKASKKIDAGRQSTRRNIGRVMRSLVGGAMLAFSVTGTLAACDKQAPIELSVDDEEASVEKGENELGEIQTNIKKAIDDMDKKDNLGNIRGYYDHLKSDHEDLLKDYENAIAKIVTAKERLKRGEDAAKDAKTANREAEADDESGQDEADKLVDEFEEVESKVELARKTLIKAEQDLANSFQGASDTFVPSVNLTNAVADAERNLRAHQMRLDRLKAQESRSNTLGERRAESHKTMLGIGNKVAELEDELEAAKNGRDELKVKIKKAIQDKFPPNKTDKAKKKKKEKGKK